MSKNAEHIPEDLGLELVPHISSWLENWLAPLSESSMYPEQEGILDSPGAKEEAHVTLGCLQA